MKPQKSHFFNSAWTQFGEDLLCGSLSHISTSWRVISLTSCHTTREYESNVMIATFSQFYEWIKVPLVVMRNEAHPFHQLPKFEERKVAVYADYKHIHDIFQDILLVTGTEVDEGEDIKESGHHIVCRPQLVVNGTKLCFDDPQDGGLKLLLDWREIDEDALDAEHGTLWIGSYGAHTPLHYDSYGRNIILQIYGEKLWSLWSPSEENLTMLSPSRIPYEESSIYADRNRFDPRNKSHLESHPPDHSERLITHEILHLPKHWWHYVTTVSKKLMPQSLSLLL